MKALILMSTLGLFLLAGCSRSPVAKVHRQKTPSHLLMSQEEKTNVNFDQRETRRILGINFKHREANKKASEKARVKQNQELNELNKNTSKVKRKKSSEAFGFY